MRTVTKVETLYKFDELESERAKDRVREWYRGCMGPEDWDADNYIESIRKFGEWFGFKVRDYSIGNHPQHCDIEFTLDESIENLAYVRLWKWLHNRGDAKFIRDGADGSCPFTGWHTDCPLFDPLRDFLDRPWNCTFRELLERCRDSWLDAIHVDYEYRYSDEAVDESILANEYEFTADGSFYS